MDYALDLIATLSRWSRSHLSDISLAIMATLLVLFGPAINAWVQQRIGSLKMCIRDRYNTPNIHFCTFQDFERLCRQLRMRVLDRLAVDRDHRHGWASRLWPNLLGEIGIYRVTGPGVQTRNLAV